jgi:hypothetical protein
MNAADLDARHPRLGARHPRDPLGRDGGSNGRESEGSPDERR